MSAGIITRLLTSMARAAPMLASQYIATRNSPAPAPPAYVNTSTSETATGLPPGVPVSAWKVPMVRNGGGELLVDPLTNEMVNQALMNEIAATTGVSREALLAAASYGGPFLSSALAMRGETVPSGAVVQTRSGLVLDCEPGINKSKNNMAMAIATLGEIAVACDVVMKYDPTPGTLAARFIGEELGSMIITDPSLHENLRRKILKDVRAGKARMKMYDRPIMRRIGNELLLDVNVLADPLGESRELFTGNRNAGAYNQNVQLLSIVPKYKLVKEVLSYDPFAKFAQMRPGASPPPDLGRRGGYYSGNEGLLFDKVCCDEYAFQTSGLLNNGPFYSSPTFTATVGSLEPGVYGQTRIDVLPFEITVSDRNIPQRALISFVHEALHGYDELHKLGIGHDQLHSLAVYLTQEAIPAYLQLSDQIGTQE